MKYYNLIYVTLAVLIIGAAIMRMFSLPYANGIIILSFAGMTLVQNWQISFLKIKIKELENRK